MLTTYMSLAHPNDDSRFLFGSYCASMQEAEALVQVVDSAIGFVHPVHVLRFSANLVRDIAAGDAPRERAEFMARAKRVYGEFG